MKKLLKRSGSILIRIALVVGLIAGLTVPSNTRAKKDFADLPPGLSGPILTALSHKPTKHLPLSKLLKGKWDPVYAPPRTLPDPRGRAPAGGIEPTSKPQLLCILVDEAFDVFEKDSIWVHIWLAKSFGWRNGEKIPVEVDFIAANDVLLDLGIQRQGALSYAEDEDLKIVPETLREIDEPMTPVVTKHRILFDVMTTESTDNDTFPLNLKLRYALDAQPGQPIPWRVLETSSVDTETCKMAGKDAKFSQDDLSGMPPRKSPWIPVLTVLGIFVFFWTVRGHTAWIGALSKLPSGPRAPNEVAWQTLVALFAKRLENCTISEIGCMERSVRLALADTQSLQVNAVRKANLRREKKGKPLKFEPVQIPFLSVTKEKLRQASHKGGYANCPLAESIARFLEICEKVGCSQDTSLRDVLNAEQLAERRELQRLLPLLVEVPYELKGAVKRTLKAMKKEAKLKEQC